MNIKIVSSEPVAQSQRFIEITPEMIAAGLSALHGQYLSQLEMIKAVYKAMRRLASS
jgi:hypothetical protein